MCTTYKIGKLFDLYFCQLYGWKLWHFFWNIISVLIVTCVFCSNDRVWWQPIPESVLSHQSNLVGCVFIQAGKQTRRRQQRFGWRTIMPWILWAIYFYLGEITWNGSSKRCTIWWAPSDVDKVARPRYCLKHVRWVWNIYQEGRAHSQMQRLVTICYNNCKKDS